MSKSLGRLVWLSVLPMIGAGAAEAQWLGGAQYQIPGTYYTLPRSAAPASAYHPGPQPYRPPNEPAQEASAPPAASPDAAPPAADARPAEAQSVEAPSAPVAVPNRTTQPMPSMPSEAEMPAAAPPATPLPKAVAPKVVVPKAVEPKTAVPKILPADFIDHANQPVLPTVLTRGDKKVDPAIARLQILLDRSNVSPGVIDGMNGGNLGKAIAALQNMNGLPSTGRLGPEIDDLLAPVAATPVLVPYVITAEDVAGPFYPNFPKDYAQLAQLATLGYRNPAEGLAERFHMDEGFLRRLNPGADFGMAGTTIIVADVGPPAKAKVAHLVADSSVRQLFGYDAAWNLVVAYPATIGSTDMPSPTGIHAVKAIAVNPVYWYRPAVNFQQGNNTKPLKLAPGPNNPVGAVWIGLDKPTYGIHGSPEPSRIDKTNSHGCLRLTNWDAKELAHLVKPGVDVEFVDPSKRAPDPKETASIAAAPAQ